MTKMKERYSSYICLSLFVVFVSVSAVFASDFAGTSSGIFQNPTGPAGMVTTGAGTNLFTWGDPNGFGTGPSSLTFTGGPFSGNFESEFSFGSLNFFNGTVVADTGANTVGFKTTLSFTLPPGLNEDFNFLFQLINSPNTGSPDANADIVKLSAPFDPAATVNIGGTNYYLQFTRFGNVGPGGFITGVNEFRVLEGASANAELFGKLTTNPVPEPTTMLLLGSGLVGLAGYGRKKIFKK